MIQIPNITTKRLSKDSDYIRPEKTLTELIQTKSDIEEKLQDYVEIEEEDVSFININTSLRYLSYDVKNKKELFRFGGNLVKMSKEYVVLAGKDGLRFSVQRYTKNNKGEIVHTTRFFKRMKKIELLKEELEESAEKSGEIIEKQNSIIEKQRKELLALKKKLQQSH
jgi:hypothetical protein